MSLSALLPLVVGQTHEFTLTPGEFAWNVGYSALSAYGVFGRVSDRAYTPRGRPQRYIDAIVYNTQVHNRLILAVSGTITDDDLPSRIRIIGSPNTEWERTGPLTQGVLGNGYTRVSGDGPALVSHPPRTYTVVFEF